MNDLTGLSLLRSTTRSGIAITEKYGVGTTPTQYSPLTHDINEQALYDPKLEYNFNLTMPSI